MANEKKITMTQEGYDELVRELKWREGEERERIKNDIVTARGFGDLSENAEYDAARNAQAENEARILQLKSDIENAQIHDASKVEKGVVAIGSTVEVKNLGNGAKMTFRIVGSNEASPAELKISDMSPIGRALVGKKAGATVTVDAPSGSFELNILKVERTKNK